MSENEMIKFEEIQSRIYTIHDVQVMLDEDLAKFYGVETRVLNQAVKRNINRFPESYMFQLAEDETDDLISQYVISSSGHGGRRKLPYVFTEQGVAMLAGVLRSDTAIKMSIQIINAFVAMRRFITTNAHIFQRLDTLEIKQINTDKKIDAVLNAIERKEIQPKQGIFFDDQIFDAYKFVADLIRTAQRSITIIDNYIDDEKSQQAVGQISSQALLQSEKSIAKQAAAQLVQISWGQNVTKNLPDEFRYFLLSIEEIEAELSGAEESQ
jgi:hypothetical protein